MLAGHGDYHPAFGRSFSAQRGHRGRPAVVDLRRRGVPRARVQRLPLRHLGDGLERLEHRPADRLGRAGRHLRPRPARDRCRRPTRRRPPASAASRSTAPATGCPRSSCRRGSSRGSVYNEEYRHTSLIATLRKTWDLGDAFTQRDASARTFDHVFSLDTPRDPNTWTTVKALPVPEWTMDVEVVGESLSALGKTIGTGPDRQGERDGREASAGTRYSWSSACTRRRGALLA